MPYLQFSIFADTAFLFSKSYSETKSTTSTAKCRQRKSFGARYFELFCVSFSTKSKVANAFPNVSLERLSLMILFWCKHCDCNKEHYFSKVEDPESGWHLNSSRVSVPGADASLETESWVLDLRSESVSKLPGFG